MQRKRSACCCQNLCIVGGCRSCADMTHQCLPCFMPSIQPRCASFNESRKMQEPSRPGPCQIMSLVDRARLIGLLKQLQTASKLHLICHSPNAKRVGAHLCIAFMMLTHSQNNALHHLQLFKGDLLHCDLHGDSTAHTTAKTQGCELGPLRCCMIAIGFPTVVVR